MHWTTGSVSFMPELLCFAHFLGYLLAVISEEAGVRQILHRKLAESRAT